MFVEEPHPPPNWHSSIKLPENPIIAPAGPVHVTQGRLSRQASFCLDRPAVTIISAPHVLYAVAGGRETHKRLSDKAAIKAEHFPVEFSSTCPRRPQGARSHW